MNSDTVGGWVHYDPGLALGQTNSYTFPPDGAGGRGYQLFGPRTHCDNFINRGGSAQPTAYTEFFQSVELNNYNPMNETANAFVAARVQPLAIPSTAGQLNGYIAVFGVGRAKGRQSLLADIEFTQEITSHFLDPWRGGIAPLTYIPPSRKTRLVFSGINQTCKAELYDVTDLLEPIARINFQDSTTHTSEHTSGASALGWLNINPYEPCDFTWDNYHATPNRNTYVGFPGTPQVAGLVPAVQTLFYSIPATNQITFTVTTFNTNQIATNTMKLFLNDVDVSSGLSFKQVIDTNLLGMEIGTTKTNFSVRWNGALTSNTVYHGQIRALDLSGKGTTNNWYFDTFAFFNPTNPASPYLLIEAEDYNYGSGQFFDYPLVSGTDDSTVSYDHLLDVADPGNYETLGPAVNRGGTNSYYNGVVGNWNAPVDNAETLETVIVGTPEVDYHDTITSQSVSDARVRSQYRSMDFVSTVQGTKNGGFDTPRPYRMNLLNETNGLSYVPDYIVAELQRGDWMNYTRTFPSNRYNVYLRASSQGRQDVRLDEVTGDRTQTNQATVLRGQFLVPNTEGLTRFRYVPLTDEAGNLQTLTLSGVKTLRLTAAQSTRGITPTDSDVWDLQLNYMLFVPTTAPASSLAFISSGWPSANSANFGAEDKKNVSLTILNRGSSNVATNSIVLRFDGVNVTGSATISATTSDGGPGATVGYQPTSLLLPNSVHTLSLVYGDGSTTQSNFWNFTIEPFMPTVAPGDAVAGPADTNFTIKMYKIATGSSPSACSSATVRVDDNNIPRAKAELDGFIVDDTGTPYPNDAAGTNGGFYTETKAINYSGNGTDAGQFTGDTNFPGIGPNDPGWEGGSPAFFAMSATIKLQLAAGLYRMGVDSDDEFALTAGGAAGTNTLLGASQNALPDTRNDGQFEFVVQTNGIYTFRLVYEEGGPPSRCEWYYVNPNTGVRTLVTPTPQLLSSATLNGAYTVESTAAINPVAKTITVAKAGNTRFYKLIAGSALNITSITLSGGNVVLTYQ